MKKLSLFVLLLCLFLTSLSLGALDACLRLEGENQGRIEGDCLQSGHQDEITVIGFSHQVHAPRDSSTGLPTGDRQHEPLRITKKIDKATPMLMAALTSQETMTRFELRFFIQPSGPGTYFRNHYSIILTGAKVISVRQEMPNNQYPDNVSHQEREHVTFVYDSIQWINENNETRGDDWYYVGAQLPVSDLTGDGRVNLLDFAVMADEWLGFPR